LQGDATVLKPTVMCAVPLVLDRIYKGIKTNIKKKGEFTSLLMDFCYNYRYPERDSVTRFFASGFFHESPSPKPLIITLGSFQIFSKIRGDFLLLVLFMNQFPPSPRVFH
jgi:long-subunit acyl-CoA synthetase (AMP-forming)